MKTQLPFTVVGLALFSMLSLSVLAIAQNDPADTAANKATAKADTKAASDQKPPSAKEVEDALRAKLKPKPAPVDTNAPPAATKNDPATKTDNVKPPAVTSVGRTDTPDPRIIGIAPGQRKPKLRREGEFLINRRGRLVASGDATQKMFVFDADSAAAPEAPMFLLPCRLLENMESLAKNRSDRMVFQLSGQVFVYRGANYLLPTMMRPAVDKGNLRK